MEKESKLGSDICLYYDDGYYYVRACEKGKYCANGLSSYSYLEIFTDIPNSSLLPNLNDGKCQTTLDCEGNLLCNGNTCTKWPVSNEVTTGEYPYNCLSNSQKGKGFCESVTSDANNGLDTKYGSPENNQKCGKLTIKEYPNTSAYTYSGIFNVSLNEYTYIGTVQDGEYVDDMEFCESGFALPFIMVEYLMTPNQHQLMHICPIINI